MEPANVQSLPTSFTSRNPQQQSGQSTAPLNKPRQTKYWLRCLKTYLPSAYQSNDSQRLSLAFFILCALDLLGELDKNISGEERVGYIAWVYRCQHPQGGFKGSTSTTTSSNTADSHISHAPSGDGCNLDPVQSWDPANLGATFFALAALIILGDDLEKVKRKETLQWLKELQGTDGTFGEARGRYGTIEGGEDVRFCYLAAGVRWILRVCSGGRSASDVEDIDVDSLTQYVFSTITYEGGMAQTPLQEAQAGATYCGIGTLSLLGRFPQVESASEGSDIASLSGSLDEDFADRVARWLVHRQTTHLQETVNDEDMFDDALDSEEGDSADDVSAASAPSFSLRAAHPANTGSDISESIEKSADELSIAGFNGRANKLADTCYAWWVGGTLGMLHKSHLQDRNAAERYLLEKTQHMVGGFSKLPGDPPDILHSCLGLAALAAMRHPDLKSIDPMLCISMDAKESFEERCQRGEQGEKPGQLA